MIPAINDLFGREILDSRGNPTLEVELMLSNGTVGRGMVPSGASTGEHEALELRDGDLKRYLGRGVLKATQLVNSTVRDALKGKSFDSPVSLDQVLLGLDPHPQKTTLGANTILGVSLAFIHALSETFQKPLFMLVNEWMGLKKGDLSLPIPMMNILNGGLHANNGLEIQEFMIVPHGFHSFGEGLRAGVEIFQHLKKNLHDRSYSTAVGDEGGFAPTLESNESALDSIIEAIQKAGYQAGEEVSIALDIASSAFYSKERKAYSFRYQKKSFLEGPELVQFYSKLIKKYPIVSIEDGLDENDWVGWGELTSVLGNHTQLVGDDLFVTRKDKVEKGVKEHVANAVLIKINQVGSIKETFETLKFCQENKYRTIISHRSGETEDTTISHLAVGSGAGQIKTGSLSRGERTAKYNELLRIESYAKKNKISIPYARVF